MYRILICDDERDIVSALKIYLSGEDYEIYTAYSGKEALELVRSRDIQLILMDIMMPEMDGMEALREIRLRDPRIPVIMQTAYAFDTDRRAAEAAGCSGFLTKPVIPAELKACLDRALGEKA